MSENKKIALVLSSGGARGNAHIGAIQEICERGYEISSIAGASMGAVIGGVYAAGKLNVFTDWICSLHKMDVFSLMDFTLSKQGFVKADRVFNEIKKFIPDNQIEDLKIPFTAVATDLKKKESIVFRKGSLFQAVRASVAIPLVITPVLTDNKILVDGGLLAPIPLKYVSRAENDLIVVVNVNAGIPFVKATVENEKDVNNGMHPNRYFSLFREQVSKKTKETQKESLGFFELLTNTSNLMLSELSRLILELNPPDILINVSREACESYDFYRASEMIDLGRKAAKESLDQYENSIK